MTSASTVLDDPARVPFWQRPFRLVGENRRAYLWLNIAAYGLVAVGFVVGFIFPELNTAQGDALEHDGTGDTVRGLVGIPPLFALVIFGVNVWRLSFLTILLPSFVIPFAGLATFGYWAVQTGITLAPVTAEKWVLFIPHSLTVLIELQAYVLLLLGVWLLGRAWLYPRTVGAPSRRRGYLRGLQRIGVLALPALVLLVIGAMWEAYSLRYLVHPLMQWILY
ncbi:stage II sporulation protein M [Agromyces laixinhei]|uniref:stage II sporulation protein M n=1 Tax=Agromyces laixinhei TaxID=2585717 RepID=UPI0018DCC888|nr:stage II sporulation protein M [Agromyces laixinhei]